jgi:hypothetical protein
MAGTSRLSFHGALLNLRFKPGPARGEAFEVAHDHRWSFGAPGTTIDLEAFNE